jgi:Tfp pilus assembly protein PilN
MAVPQEIIINLIEVDQSQVRRKRYALTSIILIIAIVGVLAGAYFSAFSAYREQQLLNKELKVQMARYDKLQEALRESETIKKQVSVKSDTVAQIEALQISYTRILKEISGAQPHGVIVTNTIIAPEKISISGFSANHHEVARFLSGLRESPIFKEVRVVSSEVDAEGAENIFTIESGWGVEDR